MSRCLVALGSNEGDRLATLSRAVAQLTQRPEFSVREQSRWHETRAIGGPADQTPYINGAIVVETSLPPLAVLGALQEIEASLGRVRKVRWGARTVDLDLLLYDDLIMESPRLTLPHPRMAFRKFVIEPAAEIAGSWRHPRIHWTMHELCEHLRHAVPYVAVTGPAPHRAAQLAARLATQLDGRLITDANAIARLPASSTDSAGRRLQAEIELPGERQKLLDREVWTPPAGLTISDFWIDQSRAYATASRDANELQAIAAVVDDIDRNTVRPKLLILLDVYTDVTMGDEEPKCHTVDDALRRAFVALATRPGVGPLLHLTGDDGKGELSDALLAEAVAAIMAMS